MQLFANGKRVFHSFIEFYAIHLKNQKGKNLIIAALKVAITVEVSELWHEKNEVL